MPVLAIGAAGAALLGGGAAAIGAVGGAIAAGTIGALSLGTVLTAVGAVGATIGAIGHVIGDRDLAMAGMVMGGIGAVGSLAASAGLFGEATTVGSLFGSGSQAASSVGAEAAASSANIVDSLGGVTIPKTAVEVSQLAPIGADAAAAGAKLPGLINASSAGTLPVTVAASELTNAAIPNVAMSAAAPVTTAVKGVAESIAPSLPQIGEVAEKSMGSGFMSFLDEHPWAGYGLVQSSGAFLSGLTDPVGPAQVEALEAQAAANRAATSLTELQQANMKQPLPVAKRNQPAPVTGVPQGLINYAPSHGAMVTGAPL